jgi:hypothetical protein
MQINDVVELTTHERNFYRINAEPEQSPLDALRQRLPGRIRRLGCGKKRRR